MGLATKGGSERVAKYKDKIVILAAKTTEEGTKMAINNFSC